MLANCAELLFKSKLHKPFLKLLGVRNGSNQGKQNKGFYYLTLYIENQIDPKHLLLGTIRIDVRPQITKIWRPHQVTSGTTARQVHTVAAAGNPMPSRCFLVI